MANKKDDSTKEEIAEALVNLVAKKESDDYEVCQFRSVEHEAHHNEHAHEERHKHTEHAMYQLHPLHILHAEHKHEDHAEEHEHTEYEHEVLYHADQSLFQEFNEDVGSAKHPTEVISIKAHINKVHQL